MPLSPSVGLSVTPRRTLDDVCRLQQQHMTASLQKSLLMLCFQAEIEEVGEEAPHQTNLCRRYLMAPPPPTHFEPVLSSWLPSPKLTASSLPPLLPLCEAFCCRVSRNSKNEHNLFILNEREELVVTLELIEMWTKAQHIGEVVQQVN